MDSKTETVSNKTDNELIAEFMGLKKSVVFGKVIYGEFAVYDYDKKWDWLMPVVEKITPIAKNVGQQAWFDTGYFLLDGNIKVVHERVVKFIRWYNSQSPATIK